jgi:transposase
MSATGWCDGQASKTMESVEVVNAGGELGEQLMRDRRRAEARGRAIALGQGIEVPAGWWRGARWREFSQELPEWMSLQVRHWKEQAVSLDRQERKIRDELEKGLEVELPIGVGALSWVILQRELRGWDRFHNRRQIASYTGLCPGIHRSNGRGREGSINRCGNSVVRYTLIEMAWHVALAASLSAVTKAPRGFEQ